MLEYQKGKKNGELLIERGFCFIVLMLEFMVYESVARGLAIWYVQEQQFS